MEAALTSLAERERQARILGDAEFALERARAAAQAAHRAGRLSLIEVMDADMRLHSLRDARVQAQSDATRAAITAFKALGGGWKS